VITVDANLLIYAYDQASRHHDAARAWLENALSTTTPVGLPWSSIHAFVRITTNPKIVQPALSITDALTIVNAWLDQPNVATLNPGPMYWSIFQRVATDARVHGNLVNDAHLAALAIEHGATIYTADGDFARFGRAQVINPLA
jgi:toxin-antitoxin system PIN domain toxin